MTIDMVTKIYYTTPIVLVRIVIYLVYSIYIIINGLNSGVSVVRIASLAG